MRPILLFFSCFVLLTSCAPEKISADLLIKNATIYTVNDAFEIANAMVVHKGEILEIGLKPELELKYDLKKTFDAKGATIVPGLIDGHAHLYNLGVFMQQVDLIGTNSFDEVVDRVVTFFEEKQPSVLLGRGWDQNDWAVKEYPNKKIFDSLFPSIPVALTRVDGHAMIANSKAMEIAGITNTTVMEGGEILLDSVNQLTGILIDNPNELVKDTLSVLSVAASIQALKDAEAQCVSLGLTTVNDAGLDREIIELIDSLHQTGELKIKVYAMISNSKENLDYYLSKGVVETDRLTVRSVKVYADGALGSRGATLREPYHDKPGHFGAMITPSDSLNHLAKRIAKAGYQMNTHAIGDSANIAVLRAYKDALVNHPDARWKVEHAQIVSTQDFDKFSRNMIPSIQPTHATSDMYWAEDRVGAERIKGAYAYKTLLEKAGIVVLGTDFPVENVNPMHTFYAAVARKDLQQYPDEGFRMEEALSREETLKGMTIWAAFSNFEEDQKGSIEVGKAADFTVLDRDIMQVHVDSIPKTKVLATFINGEMVYEKPIDE